jgi:hypothetical protein
MSKGSNRRREDRARVAANWARIDWSSTPQTTREVPAPQYHEWQLDDLEGPPLDTSVIPD